MIREGRICGIGFFEIFDWTWGEVQEFVSCVYEKERRLYQNLSIIAARHAGLVTRILSQGGQIDVPEEFPFWTEEERTELRIARLKRSLMR